MNPTSTRGTTQNAPAGAFFPCERCGLAVWVAQRRNLDLVALDPIPVAFGPLVFDLDGLVVSVADSPFPTARRYVEHRFVCCEEARG